MNPRGEGWGFVGVEFSRIAFASPLNRDSPSMLVYGITMSGLCFEERIQWNARSTRFSRIPKV